MTNIDKTNHTVSSRATVREALERINSLNGVPLTLFATDESGRVEGSVTDGDVRRALLGGIPLSAPVGEAMRREFLSISEGCQPMEIIASARKRGVRLLPRLDSDGRLREIVDLSRTKSILPLDAVLMAGGKGERLRPLTLTTPKPLLEIGGKAIIDYNVDELEANGIERIFVTVNYLKEQIKEHFSAPRRASVVCVEEPRRLGTMGSLSLVEGITSPDLLVMNSDILTNLSFEAMLNHHKAVGADLTMATVGYNVAIPFAILEIDGDRVVGLREKPSFNYSANAGVYIMKREMLKRIAHGEYLDAPDFVERLIADGMKVAHFPISGTWIDIGSPADFKYADELMSRPGK